MSGEGMAVFASESEARDAYFREDGEEWHGGDGGPGYGDGWDEPEEVDELAGFWFLLRQEQTEGTATRYFLLPGPYEDPRAMTRGGGTDPIADDATFDELPSFDTEDEAREAHALWVEENPDLADADDTQGEETHPEENEEATDSDGNVWSAWDLLEEAPPWFVFTRVLIESEGDAEGEEFLIAGENADGQEVYLHPGVAIEAEPYIYETIEGVGEALMAYFEAVENGDVPEEDQPTGNQPDDDQVARDAGPPGRGGGPVGQRPADRQAGGVAGMIGYVLGAAFSNPLLTVVVIVAIVMLYRRYGDGFNFGGDARVQA